MSMLFGENKCFFKAACALAFGLTLALTACDGGDKVLVQLDDSGVENPSPATSLPLKVEDLICSEDMQIDGRYLEVYTLEDDGYSYSYYKCENGKWISVSGAEVDKAYDSAEETLVYMKCLGVDCYSKRDFADFRKCNAKNEGLVDSTVDEYEGVVIDFYICKNNEWVYDDERSASRDDSNPFSCGQEPNLDCDESYEIDGTYYTNTWCSSSPYYKCENNKWSLLPEGDEPPEGAIVINRFRLEARDLIQRYSFKKCNAENEGLVDSVVHVADNPKYDRDHIYYYKCEQGSWNAADGSVTCDTAGVSLGDVCEIRGSCYKYLGDGAWEGIECLDLLEKECNAENKGAKEKIVYTNGEDYYVCFNKYKVDDEKNYSWSNDKIEYECFTDTTDFGDVCSVNVSGETKYFQYQYNDYLGIGQWNEGGYDSKLDFCHDDYDEVEFGDDVPGSLISEANGKYFYCDHGEWFSAHIVPQQYSDSRKEGLTDEEYDVLELPKEANVGDRVGGLLEKCFNSESSTETTDAYFCLHQNYYRYREDGTWTLETWDDMLDDPSFDTPDCTPETEGMEWSIPPTSDEPGKIYKRKKVTPWYSDYQVHYDCEEELVEYVFARSEKK
ncbi:hypothetical protein [uncultured Fibrobacter sp.]|uniref:hypothetical protein n=1 Tax=uncultured Fibrobacter sp. TaxID=261512 RepID=UPI0025DA93D6|nr:hypothetical protein [uncultured Fibrobacter sp.]